MTRMLVATLVLGLAACGDSAPPPKPAAPTPQTKAPEVKPEPKPEAKAPEAPKPDPDKELAQRVKKALESDARVPGGAIDVTAAGGRITLWGTTSTEGERSRAAQIASKVEGVTSVENQLKIVKGS
jgi:hypothetical protein